MSQPFSGYAYAKSLPASPGVYKMFDAAGACLYIGKAKNLHDRVGQYFDAPASEGGLSKSPAPSSKDQHLRPIEIMIDQVASMDVVVVPHETDALVLESQLIKNLKPKYNVLLRHGSGYPYLHLTDHPTPRLSIHFGARPTSGQSFGPFPSYFDVKQVCDVLHREFQIRSCADSVFANRSRPCLEYQIGRCSAPCVQKITPDRYQKSVSDAAAVLSGTADTLTQKLTEQMLEASQSLNFEHAALLRDRVQKIRKIQSSLHVSKGDASALVIAAQTKAGVAVVTVLRVQGGAVVDTQNHIHANPLLQQSEEVLDDFVSQYIIQEVANLPPVIALDQEIASRESLNIWLKEQKSASKISAGMNSLSSHMQTATLTSKEVLDQKLRDHELLQNRWTSLQVSLGLSQLEHIECFDISHTQGEKAVASCVVFGDQGAIKKKYRSFNIDGITPGDDYAAMRQAVKRRYAKNPLPDLLLIDGGAGQVQAAMDALVELGQAESAYLVGVSKGPERVVGDEVLVRLGQPDWAPGREHPALQMIIQIRDEAHRFALKKHTAQRDKKVSVSLLQRIPGIGPTRRRALLLHFGGLDGLRSAGADQISSVDRIGPDLAQKIVDFLRQN